jgi:hypothetical protein
MVGLSVLYTAAMGGSRPLAKKAGAWPSVIAVAAVTAAASELVTPHSPTAGTGHWSRADGPRQPRMDAAAQDTASKMLTTSTGAGVVARDMGAAALRTDPVGELPVPGPRPRRAVHRFLRRGPGQRPPRGPRRPLPAADPAPGRPRQPHQRIRASRIEAQVKTCGQLVAPDRRAPG